MGGLVSTDRHMNHAIRPPPTVAQFAAPPRTPLGVLVGATADGLAALGYAGAGQHLRDADRRGDRDELRLAVHDAMDAVAGGRVVARQAGLPGWESSLRVVAANLAAIERRAR